MAQISIPQFARLLLLLPLWWQSASVHAQADTLSLPTYIAIYPTQAQLSPLETDLRRDLNQANGRLTSPYLSLANFLLTLQEHYYYPHLAAKSLSSQGLSTQEGIELARKIKRVMDGRGIYIPMDELPKDSNYVDKASNRHRYVLSKYYPDLYLERINGEWVFPQRSQKAAQQLYNDLYPWGIDKLLSLLPDTFRYTGKVLGFSLWNVCALLIVLALVICIHKVLSLLLTVVVQFMLQYLHFGRYAGKVIAPVARPLSIVLVLHLALTLVPAIELAPDLTRWLLYAFDIIIPVFFTVILYRIAGIVSEFLKARAQKTEGTLDDQLVPVITNLLRTLVVITGVIMVFYNLKVDLTALIAGLSIGGLALALAAQDTVKNFFGSLVIFLDKPFQVGQLIKTGEVEGVVESVGIRATRVRTLHNSLVYVPNAVLADRAIDNLGMRNYRRMLITISIQYDTPPDLIEAYTEALNTLVHTHPSANKDLSQVHLNALGASSIDIRFCAFFDLPTFSEELLARQEMLLAIIRIAHQLGIQFAFPTQTVHIENLPGQPSLSAEYTLNAQTAREVAQKALAAEAATWRKPPTQP